MHKRKLLGRLDVLLGVAKGFWVDAERFCDRSRSRRALRPAAFLALWFRGIGPQNLLHLLRVRDHLLARLERAEVLTVDVLLEFNLAQFSLGQCFVKADFGLRLSQIFQRFVSSTAHDQSVVTIHRLDDKRMNESDFLDAGGELLDITVVFPAPLLGQLDLR